MIKKATGVDVEIVEGRRGEFTVWAGESIVAQKDDDLGFPPDEDIVAAVRSALNLP
jgi:hypothetical protein